MFSYISQCLCIHRNKTEIICFYIRPGTADLRSAIFVEWRWTVGSITQCDRRPIVAKTVAVCQETSVRVQQCLETWIVI